MKLKFVVLRVLALAVLSIFLSASLIEAAKTSDTELNFGLLCDGVNVRVRSAPSTKAKIVGTLNNYEFVHALVERNTGEKWSWIKISVERSGKSLIGWVYGKYLAPFE